MNKNRYVFSNGRLKRKDSTIYYIDLENNKKYFPIEQLDSVHIFGEVDFNSSFFLLMNQHNIFVHFYNFYGYYSGSFIPRKKQISGFLDVQQSAHYLDLDRRIFLARRFIEAAVHHMLRNLRRKKDIVGDIIETIEKEKEKIYRYNTVEQLMGIEGQIRRTYYKAFNPLIKNEFFHMTSRTKRPPTDPINAMISFGNGLIYTAVTTELYNTTLNPTISFLHEPSTKRYSLSLDIAEIFKPLIIDSLIFTLINKGVMKPNHFDQKEGICYLNEQGRQIFISEYEKKMSTTVKHRELGRKVSYQKYILLEAHKLVKHLLGDQDYKPLKAWW